MAYIGAFQNINEGDYIGIDVGMRMKMESRKTEERGFFFYKCLTQTDIWRGKSEGRRILIDPSLFSDPK